MLDEQADPGAAVIEVRASLHTPAGYSSRRLQAPQLATGRTPPGTAAARRSMTARWPWSSRPSCRGSSPARMPTCAPAASRRQLTRCGSSCGRSGARAGTATCGWWRRTAASGWRTVRWWRPPAPPWPRPWTAAQRRWAGLRTEGVKRMVRTAPALQAPTAPAQGPRPLKACLPTAHTLCAGGAGGGAFRGHPGRAAAVGLPAAGKGRPAQPA